MENSEKLETDGTNKSEENNVNIIDNNELDNIELKENIVDNTSNVENNSFNLFNFTMNLFLGDTFDNIINSISVNLIKFTKFLITKPYDYINNDKINGLHIDWLNKNIFNNFKINVENSIKVLSMSTIFILFYIFLLNISLVIRTLNVMKINSNINDIRLVLAEQERTLNNIAKIGFNYVVENNCSMIP